MTAPMLLDSEQAAELLNVSTRTLRQLVKDGEIAYVPRGAGRAKPRLGFTMDDINEYIRIRRTRECPSTSHKTPRITTSTSKSQVYDIMVLRAQRTAEKQKPARR